MKFGYQSVHKAVALGLLCGAAAVAGASPGGYVVDPSQEPLIKMGMTKAEVQNLIGRPPREATYAIAKGSTWVYSVRGRIYVDFISPENIVYEVDFDPEGRVVWSGERDLR